MRIRAYTVYSDFGHPLPSYKDGQSEEQRKKIRRWQLDHQRFAIANLGRRRVQQKEDGTLFILIFEQRIPVDFGQTKSCLFTSNDPIAYSPLDDGGRKKRKRRSSTPKDEEPAATLQLSPEEMKKLFGE